MPVTAAALVIGDEILSGRTKDQNIGAIAEHLSAIGIDLKEVRVVGDEEAEIVAALDALRTRYDYVFTTGGIGPTHDDITADAVGKAFGVAVEVNAEARELLRAAYASRGLELTPARLRMARIPVGASLVENRVSVAPGFKIGNVIVMAGVPSVMKAMLLAATQQLRTGVRTCSISIVLARPEADIAELFAAHQAANPDIAMGSYPAFVLGGYRTELVFRGRSEARVCEVAADLKAQLEREKLL